MFVYEEFMIRISCCALSFALLSSNTFASANNELAEDDRLNNIRRQLAEHHIDYAGINLKDPEAVETLYAAAGLTPLHEERARSAEEEKKEERDGPTHQSTGSTPAAGAGWGTIEDESRPMTEEKLKAHLLKLSTQTHTLPNTWRT